MNRDERGAPLLRRCRATIAEYGMIGAGEHVVVALSGGADSVALLHALHTLQREGDIPFTLAAAHLNHNLRGAESGRDERFVRDLCRDWGIPLTVESLPVADMARESGDSVELCARGARYTFFRRLGGKTATAHTLDDSAETVLLNLVRGTGLRGLCGIPPIRGAIIRPLIDCTRAEIETHCAAHGLAFVTDSSNLSDDYTRNRLRHAVMPALREINPAFPAGLCGMTRSLRADDDYLGALAEMALAGAARGENRWGAAQLAALPEPIRRRAIRLLLLRRGIQIDRRRIERVEELLRAGGMQQLCAEWFCRCAGGALEMLPAPPTPSPPAQPVVLRAPFESGSIPFFGDKLLTITVRHRSNFKESINILPNQFKSALDCDKIGEIIVLRPRSPGDRIRLAGRGCTKSLKKLFQEAGLPVRQRERVLVLAGEAGPLWVEGFGVSESAAAGPGTQRLLLLAVQGAQDKKSDNFFPEGGND